MSVAALNFKLSEKDLKQDPEQVFVLMDKLGEGSYGAVYKAMHIESSVVVALKIVPIENDLDDIIKEINVMNGCNNDAIVRYYGSFFKNDHLWMFIEFCPAGSVSDIMKLMQEYMREPEVAAICKSVLKGLEYLHERKKIHRDIKAGNILLSLKGEAKLADFGVAGQLSDTVAKRNTVIGTPFWMAPEIIQEVGYGVEADIWSLGITCIEMAEGKPPLYNIHPMRAIFIIPTKPPPTLEGAANFSADFNGFIARCLTKNPANRPQASQLLNDPFIAKAPSNNVLMDKVLKASELIAQGALQSPDGGEEDDGEDSALASKVHAVDATGTIVSKNKTQQTFVSHRSNDDVSSGTMISHSSKSIEEVNADFGTMLVNDSKSTMKPAKKAADAPDATATPMFMKMMKGQQQQASDATMKPVKASPSTATTTNNAQGTIKDRQNNVQPAQQNRVGRSDSMDELNEMLKALEDNMEKEIRQIRSKYEQKRLPILQAIDSKKDL